MGNSGSAHNLNSERSGIERNAQFHSNFKHFRPTSHHQYQLNRSDPPRNLNPQWRRSYQESKTQVETPFKVLPELDKRLHLRATTNGAILNSGGTISGRKLPDSHVQKLPNALSQRSQTFILESVKDECMDSSRKNYINSEFTRSQTLLNVKAKIKDSETNLSRMQRHTYSEPELVNVINQQKPSSTRNVGDPVARLANRNKYSKKRRAPEAPTTAAAPIISNNHTEILRNKNNTSSNDSNNNNINDNPKSIHFTKNADRLSKTTKQLSNQSGGTFKRGNDSRNSLSGNLQQGIISINASEHPKFNYRREKSSDAIMLKSRKSENVDVSLRKEKDHRHHIQNNVQKITINSSSQVDDVIVSTQANKTQRTFYFGMEKPSSSPSDNAQEHLPNTDNNLPSLSNYDIEYKNINSTEESMNDNGLLVHIRPTLPRRQVETPTFSPTLAWRSLIEELDRMDTSPIKENLNVWKSKVNMERPIQPNQTSHGRQMARTNQVVATWTPEQDLGDDNDDKVKGITPDDDSSSDEYPSKCDGDGLLFYGSKTQKTIPPAMSPIHTFSLSLPRDSHLNHTRAITGGDVFPYNSLQKSKPDNFFTNSSNRASFSQEKSTQHHHQTTDNARVSKFEGCNNWVLHKNVGGMDLHTKSLEHGSKRQRLVSIEPQSIKYLTGGKHVMYLPGNNDQAYQTKPTEPEPHHANDTHPKPKSNSHFKNRQRPIPQSLQDETPIFPSASLQDNNLRLDEDKRLSQRFSFNNPVRLLEKRLLTEKSGKSAKTKLTLEGEIEALKKVEEDFQRNRANEKENIQHQLRLHFGNDHEGYDQFHSLPISPVLDRFSALNINETNNKLYGRDDPEGCVSNAPCTANETAKIY